MTDEKVRSTAVQTVAAVFLPIATITVMLRIYVRGWIVKAFGWDDGAMIIAMVCPISNPSIRNNSGSFLWSDTRDLTNPIYHSYSMPCSAEP
jgi:hypothetical protein